MITNHDTSINEATSQVLQRVERGNFVQYPCQLIYNCPDLTRDDKWALMSIMGVCWSEEYYKLSFREISNLSGIPISLLSSIAAKDDKPAKEGIMDRLERLSYIHCILGKEINPTTGQPKGNAQTYIKVNYTKIWSLNTSYKVIPHTPKILQPVSYTNRLDGEPVLNTNAPVSYTNRFVSYTNKPVSYTNEPVRVARSKYPPYITYITKTITDGLEEIDTSDVANANHSGTLAQFSDSGLDRLILETSLHEFMSHQSEPQEETIPNLDSIRESVSQLRAMGVSTRYSEEPFQLEHLSTSVETVTQVINTEGATDARTSDNHSHSDRPPSSDRVGHLDVFAVDTQGTTHANHSPVARDTSPDFSDSRQSGNGVLPLGRDTGMVDRRTQEEARAATQEPLQHTTQEVNAQDNVAEVHNPTTVGRIAPHDGGDTPSQQASVHIAQEGTTPPSQSEVQPANGTMGVTQPSLVERPAKPEMPPASMKWSAEKMVQITEFKLGKYYRPKSRSAQIKAGEKIMKEGVTEEQYIQGYEERRVWWNADRGPLHVVDMAATTKRGEMRILEVLDELEYKRNNSHPTKTDRTNAKNTGRVVASSAEQIVEYNGREMPISEARKLGWHGFENYIGNGPEALEEMRRMVAEMEASGELARLGLDDIA